MYESPVSAPKSKSASGKKANIDIIAAMCLHILVLDGVFDLGLAALTDTLSMANQLAGSLAQAPAPVEVTLVGVRRRVRTAQGLTVSCCPSISKTMSPRTIRCA